VLRGVELIQKLLKGQYRVTPHSGWNNIDMEPGSC
jgi:hypothetical protein